MTICIVVTKGNLGGAQRYVESLAKLLVSTEVPTIVVAGEGDQLLPRLKKAGINVMQVEGLRNSSVLADLKLLLWLVRQLRRGEIRKVVFNSTKLLPMAWALTFFSPSSVHYVCHGFPFFPGSNSFGSRLKQSIFFGMLRRIRSVICVSAYVQSIVRSKVSGKSNITLARNTLDPSVASELAARARMKPLASKAFPLDCKHGAARVVARAPGASLRAVSLAEINANKGIDALCAALAPHRNSLSGRFEWHIFGEGKDRALVENVITDGDLGGVVFLHGFRADARDLLTNFDLLLIPSRNEAFGMVALEAAASGIFVCGAAVGGIPEAILTEDYGCTFESTEEMVEFLAKIVADGLQPCAPSLPSPSYWEQRYEDWCQIHLRTLLP